MKENVLRGVTLLDEKVPDWRKRIDRELLNMVDLCLLKQLFGYYGSGLIELKIGWNMEEAVYYGFDVRTRSEKSKKWKELTQLWKEQL